MTIIVVPRERFSYTRSSLESIYTCTESPFQLVYVDGGSPGHVKRYLETEAQKRGFTLIRTEHYLTPNEARNLGLREVLSKYVVFLDNDVVVSPGWLKTLLQCAEETGAWVVGPLYCMRLNPVVDKSWRFYKALEGTDERLVVHNAGGFIQIHEKSGKKYFYYKQRFSGSTVENIKISLRREPCDFVEFHCMMVRIEVFGQLGSLDESLLNAREYIDLCLTVHQANGSVYFEPASVVTYIPPPPLKLSDIPYYVLRWSDKWSRNSFFHFWDKWELSDDDSSDKIPDHTTDHDHLNWMPRHRQAYLNRLRRMLDHLAGSWISNWVVSLIDKIVSYVVTRRAEWKRLGRGKIQRMPPVR